MSLTTLTIEELFAEICDLARDQGIADAEAWDGLVDEVMDSHRDLGELDDEQDTEGMKEILKMKWDQYRRLNAADGIEEEDVEEEKLDDHDILGQTKDEEEMM